jgi:SnoaL-like domain
MDVASLHSPLVRRTIETINEERLDEFLALFARDATVVDGTTYHGSEAIRAWAERETFGVQMHIDVVQEKNTEGTAVEVNVTSTGGYSGPGTFFFTIREGLIERLVIR